MTDKCLDEDEVRKVRRGCHKRCLTSHHHAGTSGLAYTKASWALAFVGKLLA